MSRQRPRRYTKNRTFGSGDHDVWYRDLERVQREANAAAADARALESDAVVQQLADRAAERDGAVAGLESALPAAEVSRQYPFTGWSPDLSTRAVGIDSGRSA